MAGFKLDSTIRKSTGQKKLFPGQYVLVAEHEKALAKIHDLESQNMKLQRTDRVVSDIPLVNVDLANRQGEYNYDSKPKLRIIASLWIDASNNVVLKLDGMLIEGNGNEGFRNTGDSSASGKYQQIIAYSQPGEEVSVTHNRVPIHPTSMKPLVETFFLDGSLQEGTYDRAYWTLEDTDRVLPTWIENVQMPGTMRHEGGGWKLGHAASGDSAKSGQWPYVVGVRLSEDPRILEIRYSAMQN